MLTIITPSSSKALTTLGAVLAEIPNASAGLLEAMILRASSTVETYCGRSFGRERLRETIRNNPHGGPLLPSRWPVAAIVDLTVDGVAVDPSEVSIEGGMFAGPGRWGREVVVTYDAGYVLPGEDGRTLPHDIERVVIELVKNDWHTRSRDMSIRSENVDGVSNLAFFGSGSMLNATLAPLAIYRMPVAL